ncbi:katanin p80 WD40 repeat-containing subunit B1-like [Amphiura filiformis]|uniref:katanin p80 WD40 repeat-containing subunit B1-like n=1 Tax=Amphiura filiformis TaxID=82378 RepID=UPI003B21F3E7
MSSARGRFIRWDWHQQKYVWVSKEDLRAKAANNKEQVLKPSPYLQNCGPKRKNNQPSALRVPPNRGCKRPLKVYQKKDKLLLEAKKKKIAPKSKCAVKPSLRQQAKQPVRKTKPAASQTPREESFKKTLLQGHDTFMTVMTNRLIHQGAAITFWRQSPDALVSYLVRTNDDAVTVDILPVLTENGLNKDSGSKHLSMGSCVDFLPTLRKLLDSKFEDYIKASLDFLRMMIRFYLKDLQAMKAANKVTNLQRSQSVFGMYTSIVAMTDKLGRLAKRDGPVGQKASIVAELVQKL